MNIITVTSCIACTLEACMCLSRVFVCLFVLPGTLRSPLTYIDFFAQAPAAQQDISYHSDAYELRITIAVITSLLFLLPCALLTLLLIHRTHPRIRAATFVSCLCIIIGTLIGYIAVIVAILPRSEATCMGFFWLTGIAWVLVYGSILTKTWYTHMHITCGCCSRACDIRCIIIIANTHVCLCVVVGASTASSSLAVRSSQLYASPPPNSCSSSLSSCVWKCSYSPYGMPPIHYNHDGRHRVCHPQHTCRHAHRVVMYISRYGLHTRYASYVSERG